MTYCIVPRDLEWRIVRPIRRYSQDSGVSVITERRASERRTIGERRSAEARPEIERRSIRHTEGRRIGERRATLIPVRPPLDLPRRLRAHADRLVFVEPLELSSGYVEDLDTARLITRIQAGENSLFQELYGRYFDRVYTYLRVALHDVKAAEKLTQRVFSEILDALPAYSFGRRPFRTFLCRLVHAAAQAGAEHGGREAEQAVEAPQEEAVPTRSLRVPDWVTDAEMVLLIARLPLYQREVIMLRYMMDLTPSEVGDLLEGGVQKVREVQARGLSFLRYRLEVLGREPRTASMRLPMLEAPRPRRVVQSRRLALLAG